MINQAKLLFFLLLFFSSTYSYSANLTEHQLGIENSDHLIKEMDKNFFDGNHLSLPKVAKFKSLISKSRKEEIRLLVENLRNDQEMSIEDAKKKASKDTKIKAIDWMLFNLENLDQISGKKALESKLKDVMKVHMALIRGARDGSAIHAVKSLASLMFKKNHIPLKDSKRTRPSNLGNPDESRYYTKAELNQMIRKGVDLSEIDPVDTAFWSKPQNIAAANPLYERDRTGDIPKVFHFSKITMRESQPKLRVKEILPNGKKIKWKIKFGREVNPEVFMSRFMNLLGFHSDETYYVRDAKIYFKNEDQFRNMMIDWYSYFNKSDDYLSSRYVKEKGEDQNGYYAVFHEAVIEARPKNVLRVGDFHSTELGNWERREVRALLLIMGFINSPDFKPSKNNKVKLVKNGKDRLNWEIRELVHDLGFAFGHQYYTNAPNEYSWSFLKKTPRKLKMKYLNNQWIHKKRNPFQQASYSDLKWLARYMVQITRPQLEELAKVAGWPREVAKLIVEKMVVRRNEIVRAFNLEGKVINGNKIHTWIEVNPKTFSYGKFIKNGKLQKDYKVEGYPINYLKNDFFPDEMTKLGRLLMGPISNATKQIPWYRLATIPTETVSASFSEFMPGIGIGFRWIREIKRNPNAEREGDVWETKDTLRIFGNVGATGIIPIGTAGTLEAEIEVQALIGKSYTAIYHSATPIEALKGRIKLLASLPFKKRTIIAAMKPGEVYADGLFVGLEAEQSIATTSFVGVGTGIEQQQLFLNRTIVLKGKGGNVHVSKSFAQQFTFTYRAFIKLFSALKIDFFHAASTWGTRDKKTYHFNINERSEAKEREAYNAAVFSNKKNHPLLKNRPHTKTKEKFHESTWLFGLGTMIGIGRETKGTYVTEIRPDGETKRFYDYQTFMKTMNSVSMTNKKYKVLGRIEFSDKDFRNIVDSNLSLEVEIQDGQTEYKEMKKRTNYVNALVNDKRFFQYTPELHGTPHLGKTFMNLRFNLNDTAISCILEKIGCVAKGPKAYLIDRKLKGVRRSKKPVKRLRKLGPYLSKALMKPGKFKDFMQFIGGQNVSLDMLIEGDVISRDRYIHLKADSLKI